MAIVASYARGVGTQVRAFQLEGDEDVARGIVRDELRDTGRQVSGARGATV